MDEQAGVGAHRDALLAGTAGRVIEVGAGSGLCFGHYSGSVTEVVATEPEPSLARDGRTGGALRTRSDTRRRCRR
jgi:protein-L-isoaspartate O-methyltransferase